MVKPFTYIILFLLALLVGETLFVTDIEKVGDSMAKESHLSSGDGQHIVILRLFCGFFNIPDRGIKMFYPPDFGSVK